MAAMHLRGRVALVTGAARGIGYETVRLLSARGARVALLDVDEAEARAAAAALGDQTLAIGADVRDREAMASAVEQAREHFGAIDVVVANAGVAPPPGTMRVADVATFDRVIDVNLNGVVNTVRPALEPIIASRGHIMLVSSIYAFMNGVLATPYAMSKAAVEALGRALRVELAAHEATSGIAYFGFVDTALVRDAFAGDESVPRLIEKLPDRLTSEMTPEHAARALVEGIERRALITLRPRIWRPLMALRGVAAPLLDRVLSRDADVMTIVRDAERG